MPQPLNELFSNVGVVTVGVKVSVVISIKLQLTKDKVFNAALKSTEAVPNDLQTRPDISTSLLPSATSLYKAVATKRSGNTKVSFEDVKLQPLVISNSPTANKTPSTSFNTP